MKIEEDVEAKRETTGYGAAMGMAAPTASASLRSTKPWADVHLTANARAAAGGTPATTERADKNTLLAQGVVVINATVTITFELKLAE